MRCQFVFTPWESKALIAKAILQHPLIEATLEEGVIGIGRGTTNAYIIKEILKHTENEDFSFDIGNYVAGCVDGSLWESHPDTRAPEIAFIDGKPNIQPMNQTIEEADVLLKGANAIGSEGVAGVLCAHPQMGTMGTIYARALARGITIIVPVSLEKQLTHVITEILPLLGGQVNIDYVHGLPVSIFPVVGGELFTEIEAIEFLAPSSDVYHIGSGGIYKGAGAVILEVNGVEEELKDLISIYEEIKKITPLNVNLKPHS